MKVKVIGNKIVSIPLCDKDGELLDSTDLESYVEIQHGAVNPSDLFFNGVPRYLYLDGEIVYRSDAEILSES